MQALGNFNPQSQGQFRRNLTTRHPAQVRLHALPHFQLAPAGPAVVQMKPDGFQYVGLTETIQVSRVVIPNFNASFKHGLCQDNSRVFCEAIAGPASDGTSRFPPPSPSLVQSPRRPTLRFPAEPPRYDKVGPGWRAPALTALAAPPARGADREFQNWPALVPPTKQLPHPCRRWKGVRANDAASSRAGGLKPRGRLSCKSRSSDCCHREIAGFL